MLEQGSLHLPSVQGAWEVSLGFPGALPQRRVVWMWFGAFPGAFGLGSPGESGLISRGSQGLRSPLESRRGSLGAS